MRGRTYRFADDEPLYRFGYGLSYASFEYANLRLTPGRIGPDEPVTATAEVTNTSRRAGDEVVQLYVRDMEATVPVPRCHLEGFRRIHLAPGETQVVAFVLQPAQLACYDAAGSAFVEPGTFEVSLGGGQGDDPASGALTAELRVV
jgi:beta-glucosidase